MNFSGVVNSCTRSAKRPTKGVGKKKRKPRGRMTIMTTVNRTPKNPWVRILNRKTWILRITVGRNWHLRLRKAITDPDTGRARLVSKNGFLELFVHLNKVFSTLHYYFEFSTKFFVIGKSWKWILWVICYFVNSEKWDSCTMWASNIKLKVKLHSSYKNKTVYSEKICSKLRQR